MRSVRGHGPLQQLPDRADRRHLGPVLREVLLRQGHADRVRLSV